MKKAYIFLNGEFVKPTGNWPSQPNTGDLIIGADNGAAHVKELNWPLNVVIGDFDSLACGLLDEFPHTEIIKYPPEKDETDFELALALALERNCQDIEVLGALGGRWDMTLGNLFLPTAFKTNLPIKFRHGNLCIFTLTGPADINLKAKPYDLLSLIPWGGDILNISLDGCRYGLFNETLRSGVSRGLSNEVLAENVHLNFTSGHLMVFHQYGGV
ncbi:MAG: thiamine diphosphokinase [Candidatus Adiutrix sp.]